MYQEVADHPEQEFHFFHGREAAEMFGYEREWLDRALAGGVMECRSGTMENIPLPDASVDVAISNGVINLSFRKRRVIGELYRVLKPGGRVSIADIVSAKQLSQSIVNDPKLWAS